MSGHPRRLSLEGKQSAHPLECFLVSCLAETRITCNAIASHLSEHFINTPTILAPCKYMFTLLTLIGSESHFTKTFKHVTFQSLRAAMKAPEDDIEKANKAKERVHRWPS